MAENKNYRATTGVDKFYYGVLEDDGIKIVETSPERVKFLQEITVTPSQELIKAYGDNKIAEMATSNGPVEVSGAFHKLPSEDKQKILGLESSEDGLYGYGGTDDSPYVASVFAKTHEDGSIEWVGLPKGKFIKTENTGTSKQDSVEFGNDPISAEFMDRQVPGFAEEKSVIFGYDEKGSTTDRDAMFQAVFGTTYPVEEVEEV